MENYYNIKHYVEKTYYDGSKKTEQVKEKDPLKIYRERDLVSIKFYDQAENDEIINYSRTYYYGDKKTINQLETEFNLLQRLRPGTNKNLEMIITKLLASNKDTIIVDYRCSVFEPYVAIPEECDMTIQEYQDNLNKSLVLKK